MRLPFGMLWLVSGALTTLALPAQVGEPAPELEVDAYYNFDALKLRKLSQLRGSAVFLEYWATW